jgi:hypothetical protein
MAYMLSYLVLCADKQVEESDVREEGSNNLDLICDRKDGGAFDNREEDLYLYSLLRN